MGVNFKPNNNISRLGAGDGVIEICPKCQTKQVGLTIPFRSYDFAVCRCRNCNNLFIIEGLGNFDLSNKNYTVTTIPAFKSQYRSCMSLIPNDIQDDFEQSISCFEINSFDASITMSRRTLQHIARETLQRLNLTPTDNTLQKELECLKNNQVIFPKTFAMYEQIKKTGNFGAHPDEIDLNKHITQEEAENAIRVIILMIKEIYENDELYSKIMPLQASKS